MASPLSPLNFMRLYNLDLEQSMKKFLAIYIGTASALEKSGWNTMDEAKRKKQEASGLAAWGEWMVANEAAVVEQGGPLGKTKRTAAQGVSDTKNNMAGYVVVQAESHEAAARMFEKHPHFTIFPGDSVEIMECLPIPGRPQR
jgi:transcription antitermination factor NusG